MDTCVNVKESAVEGAGVKFAEVFVFKVVSVTCLLPHQILDAQRFQS